MVVACAVFTMTAGCLMAMHGVLPLTSNAAMQPNANQLFGISNGQLVSMKGKEVPMDTHVVRVRLH